MNDFEKELEKLINKHSKEGGSNTPDFILAQYMHNCLHAFNAAVNHREWWWRAPSRAPEPDNTWVLDLLP